MKSYDYSGIAFQIHSLWAHSHLDANGPGNCWQLVSFYISISITTGASVDAAAATTGLRASNASGVKI